jgi:hypothetical protein
MSRATTAEMDRGRSVSIVVALLIVGALWSLTADGPGDFRADEVADSTADWLVTRAALDGADPYSDVRDLAEASPTSYVVFRGKSMGDGAFVHPRPPGALLLQTPIVLLDPRLLHAVMAMTITGALGVMLIVSQRLTNAPLWAVYLGIVALVVARPTAVGVVFGVQSGVIALLVLGGWMLNRGSDSALGGAAVGLAATLKLFPALLFLVLVRYRRYRAAGSLVMVTLTLNLTGMWLFDIDLSDVRRGLDEAVTTWLPFNANASIGAALDWFGMATATAASTSWPLAAALAVGVVLARPHEDLAYAMVLVLALLGSPLSWEHYDIALIPFAAMGWSHGPGKVGRFLIASWAAVFVASGVVHRLPISTDMSVLLTGSIAFGARWVLLLGLGLVALAGRRATRPGGYSRRHPPTSEIRRDV